MLIPQSIKEKAKWQVYLSCVDMSNNETPATSVLFSVTNNMYIASMNTFNNLLATNKCVEAGYSYDIDTVLNGTYICNDIDKYDEEYYIDYVVPEYSTGTPYVIFRTPGTSRYMTMKQSEFVKPVETVDDNGEVVMKPRYEFIGYKYKTRKI